MRFEKKNKFGFTTNREEPLDNVPLTLRLKKGVREALKEIPGWQSDIRELIDEYIKIKKI
ncbi:hypothetical protein [Iningainema tapete]|uniref:Uncharacterized protein n=1 Tax=Iningainema tapete BLCC-T55 TaxID=2748662 RepID=A0A8J6XED4_9CYAN|nr:hypothetical protein [Iningainema tapete]MBD2771012.1 hypothetical protein [Iningainema tapete BLCC-T55]